MMSWGAFRVTPSDPIQGAISKDIVNEYAKKEPRRLSFGYDKTHRIKISEDTSKDVRIHFPFKETIKAIFEKEFDVKIQLSKYKKKNGSDYFYGSIPPDKLETIREWIRRQGNRHFLRDALALSVALDRNILDPAVGHYTEIGNLEHEAKANQNIPSIEKLSRLMYEAILDMPFYRDTKFICAVPPTPAKNFDLPNSMVKFISKNSGMQNLTEKFIFCEDKASIKNLAVNDKWDGWEKTGLYYSERLQGNPDVILIDDKYQSGCTIHFVASKLLAAGAGRVFGLCAVKTLRDTDNL